MDGLILGCKFLPTSHPLRSVQQTISAQECKDYPLKHPMLLANCLLAAKEKLDMLKEERDSAKINWYVTANVGAWLSFRFPFLPGNRICLWYPWAARLLPFKTTQNLQGHFTVYTICSSDTWKGGPLHLPISLTICISRRLTRSCEFEFHFRPQVLIIPETQSWDVPLTVHAQTGKKDLRKWKTFWYWLSVLAISFKCTNQVKVMSEWQDVVEYHRFFRAEFIPSNSLLSTVFWPQQE